MVAVEETISIEIRTAFDPERSSRLQCLPFSCQQELAGDRQSELGIVFLARVAKHNARPYFAPKGRNFQMQSENKLFDDFVKMVNGFAGTMAGMGREAESGAREKFREWMGGVDFVGRDEFEAVKAMAAAARDENDILKARIAALEAKVAGPPAGATKRGSKKTSPGA
jgi:BMFP domain-containing protein YqiC